jgi:multicomponent Na+:H+ antiporter subunit D
MPAPVLFVGLPLLAAPIAYLLRRARAASVVVTTLVALLLAGLALWLPLDRPVAGLTFSSTLNILGRVMELEPGDRLALALISAQAAVLFLASSVARPGQFFQAAGLANLGLLAAALFVRPFLFAAFFLEMSAAVSVLMLAAPVVEGGPAFGGRGALRYLVYATLGLPFILLTGWLVEASALSPGDPAFLARATWLLLFGFGVLLAVVPFHSWMPAVAARSSPFAVAYVFSVLRLALVFLLLTFLDTYPWLRQNPQVYRLLTVVGGGMALAGALFTFGQRNFGRVMGYVMLVDIGAVLLGIGLGTRAGVESALVTLVVRGLGLPLWAMGLARLRQAAGADTFEAVAGLGRRMPMAAAAVVVGLLSVAGFPLTVGFVGRWVLLWPLVQIHPTAAFFVLAGIVSLGLVVARGLAALITPVPTPAAFSDLPRESRRAITLYAAGLVALLVLGLFPQWLLPAVTGAAGIFLRFTP